MLMMKMKEREKGAKSVRGQKRLYRERER
jgi:hypothetical protein